MVKNTANQASEFDIVLRHVHILSVGDVVTSSGEPLEITQEKMEGIAKSYDQAIHKAPIVLGHTSDNYNVAYEVVGIVSQLLGFEAPTDVEFALGWVLRAYVQDDKLFFDIRQTKLLNDLMDSGYYQRWSISYYDAEDEISPSPGDFYLQHLAFLGATPPAFKGLQQIALSEKPTIKNKETDMDLNQKAEQYIKTMLFTKNPGLKETFVQFSEAPSEQNTWLYDKESSAYKGSFVDNQDRTLEFSIEKNENDSWDVSYQLSEAAPAKKAELSEKKEASEECWDGYERVPGKKAGEEGSCKKLSEKEEDSKEMSEEDKKKKELKEKEEEDKKEMGEGVKKPDGVKSKGKDEPDTDVEDKLKEYKKEKKELKEHDDEEDEDKKKKKEMSEDKESEDKEDEDKKELGELAVDQFAQMGGDVSDMNSLMEEMSQMREELMAEKQKSQMMMERMGQMRRDMASQFAEKVFQENKIDEKVLSKREFIQFSEMVDNVKKKVQLSEGNEVSGFDLFKKLVAGLLSANPAATTVALGEHHKPSTELSEGESTAPVVKKRAPVGTEGYSQSRKQLSEMINKERNSNPDISYEKALKIVIGKLKS